MKANFIYMRAMQQYLFVAKLRKLWVFVFFAVIVFGCSNTEKPKESVLKGNTISVALKAWNGKYVSVVEDSVGLRLIANKDQVGEREIFQMQYYDENIILFKAYNKFFVSADYGKGNFLFADKMEAYDWERFLVEDKGNKQIAIIASNGKYLCADQNIGFFIIADKDVASDWEKFSIEKQ